MTDFFSPYGDTAKAELIRIHESGPEGLREDEINPDLFARLLKMDLIEAAGPTHFRVSRRGHIALERWHSL